MAGGSGETYVPGVYLIDGTHEGSRTSGGMSGGAEAAWAFTQPGTGMGSPDSSTAFQITHLNSILLTPTVSLRLAVGNRAWIRGTFRWLQEPRFWFGLRKVKT